MHTADRKKRRSFLALLFASADACHCRSAAHVRQQSIHFMPSRVKQHQLEDISRSKFSLSLPREWVMRDKDKDYGIDAEVGGIGDVVG